MTRPRRRSRASTGPISTGVRDPSRRSVLRSQRYAVRLLDAADEVGVTLLVAGALEGARDWMEASQNDRGDGMG
jgi:hypothetical protein